MFLAKINSCSLDTTYSSRNLFIIVLVLKSLKSNGNLTFQTVTAC